MHDFQISHKTIFTNFLIHISMKNKYAFTLLFLLFAAVVSAQDVIELLDGVDIKGNVTEVTPDVIKYKAWQNQGATKEAMVLKSTVFKIRYQNGFVEIINKKTTVVDPQIEIDRLAAIQRQIEADKQAAIQRQIDADRLAATQRQIEADKLAATQRQIEADRLAATQRQIEADRLAAAQRQIETDKQAATQRQIEADRIAAAKRQNDFEKQLGIQQQMEINKKAAAEKELEDKREAAIQKQEAKNASSKTPIKTQKGDPSVLKSIRHFTAGIFGGVSLPLGLYKSANLDDFADAAGAKMGFNAGANLGYRLNSNLSFLLEGQFTLHSYEITATDVRYIYAFRGNWFHINVFPTFRFDVPITANKVGFYAQGGAGMTISLLDGDLFDAFDAAKVAGFSTHFGYSGGIGLSLSGVNIGVRYVGGNPVFQDYKPLVGQLQAVIGYQF
jgi:hypothetical protein